MRSSRAKRIVVRVSIAEHQKLTAKAQAAGLTVSTLVRDRLERLRVYGFAEKEAWLRAVTALHQSAAVLGRATAGLSAVDAAATLAYLAAIHRLLRQIIQQLPVHAREVLPPRDGNR